MITSNDAITGWLDRRCESSARHFVEMHVTLVRSVVARWLPSPHMIEDVVQETFIKAFKSMHRISSASNLPAWLSTIARNTCANHLRSWQRNIVRPLTDCGIDDYSEMLVTSDKAESEDEEIERGIDQLLSRLQHQDRQMLTMFHIENRSARDVGQSLGLSEGNVRVRLMRSHRALRDQACEMRAAGIL